MHFDPPCKCVFDRVICKNTNTKIRFYFFTCQSQTEELRYFPQQVIYSLIRKVLRNYSVDGKLVMLISKLSANLQLKAVIPKIQTIKRGLLTLNSTCMVFSVPYSIYVGTIQFLVADTKQHMVFPVYHIRTKHKVPCTMLPK